MGLAGAEDVRQGLVGVAAAAAALVSVPSLDCSVEGDDIELGSVDELPVGKVTQDMKWLLASH